MTNGGEHGGEHCGSSTQQVDWGMHSHHVVVECIYGSGEQWLEDSNLMA
jgi:hypothetical protein